jgi:hypothetical protein
MKRRNDYGILQQPPLREKLIISSYYGLVEGKARFEMGVSHGNNIHNKAG